MGTVDDPNEKRFPFLVASYMYKFGRSEPQDASLESRICRNVADFFQTKWCKREFAQGPHERSKTVAYVHKYSQPTAAGPPIQHNTCAQQTCRVRMVGTEIKMASFISSLFPCPVFCQSFSPIPSLCP